MATYTSTSPISVLGSKESVHIAEGSVVDLDLVVGESDGHPLTLETALGAHREHFQIQTPPALTRRGRAPSEPTAAPVQE